VCKPRLPIAHTTCRVVTTITITTTIIIIITITTTARSVRRMR
jgi:hypothetical protein